MKRLFGVLLLLVAFAQSQASGCEPAWQVDLPALETKTKRVLEANGIEAPAFVFAIGDSLENFYVFKEFKRKYVQYLIKTASDEDSIAVFSEKKSDLMKLLHEIYSYSKDVDFTTYVSYGALKKPRIPKVFMYYNEDGRFSGKCVDYRNAYDLFAKKNTMSERFLIAIVNYRDLCEKACLKKK